MASKNIVLFIGHDTSARSIAIDISSRPQGSSKKILIVAMYDEEPHSLNGSIWATSHDTSELSAKKATRKVALVN